MPSSPARTLRQPAALGRRQRGPLQTLPGQWKCPHPHTKAQSQEFPTLEKKKLMLIGAMNKINVYT